MIDPSAAGRALPGTPTGYYGSMPTAIRCVNLRKTYDGRVEAVRGLDLEIAVGECFGLLGPNGAGKTTSIEILEGLSEATSGEVEIFGRTWKQHRRELQQMLGVSLQETRLSEKLTVRETVALFGAFYRHPLPVDDVLATLSLTEKRDAWVGKLSGGQRQRLAVACALVADPQLLFLDEPTTGLDPQSRRQLWAVIREFQRQGRTVLLTTHYMDEAERLCDRLAIMDHGRVMITGTPAELIAQVGGHHVLEFSCAPASETTAGHVSLPDTLLQILPGVQGLHRDDNRVALHVAEPHATVPALFELVRRQGLELAHLSTRHASLEDVFVKLTGRHLRED